MKPDVLPATSADFEAAGGLLYTRARARTIKLGDKILAILGTGFQRDGTVILFGHITDEMRQKYPVLLHKTMLSILDDAGRRGIKTIAAVADPDQPAAERWMERLGFTPRVIDGRKTFLWHSSR